MPHTSLAPVSRARRLTEKELVDEARRVLRISQKDLAARLGMSEDQLYRRKTGEVTMNSRLKSQLRMIVASGRLPSDGIGTGSVTIAPRDPVVAAAVAHRPLVPQVRPEEAQFSIDFDSLDPVLAELEGAFLPAGNSVPSEAETSDLQAAHDEIAKNYPLALASGSGRVSVDLLCGRLEKFGLRIPQNVAGLSRTQRHQVDTIFREYYRSHEALREWFALLFQGDDSLEGQEIQRTAQAIADQIEMLAIAKMDLNSVYPAHVDRAVFDEKSGVTKSQLRPLLKAYLTALVAADQPIMRDPYRLVDAANDRLSLEERSLRGEDRFEAVDHFTLAERTILREVGALRREVRDLIELRNQALNRS
jgi:transcriptional regulator with XRE-family HTH domain